MIVDAQLLFSDAQAITAPAASTNLVDFRAVRDIGLGENLYVVTTVDVAMTDAGSDSTLQVDLETDDSASFGSPALGQILYTLPAVSAAGRIFIARIQPGALNERFARLNYSPANGNLTTGSFTSFITHDIQKFVAYADNITIS